MTEVKWYSHPVQIPPTAKAVLEDPHLSVHLCDFCRCMANIEIRDGKVVRVFCKSCSAVVSGLIPPCPGGSAGCCRTRYVDALGAIAPLCSACHQASKHRGKVPASAKKAAPAKKSVLVKKGVPPRNYTPIAPQHDGVARATSLIPQALVTAPEAK